MARQAQPHAGEVEPAREVAQRFAELLLARDAPGQVELAADFGRGFEQMHLMAALGQCRGRREAGRARADDRDALAPHDRPQHRFGLVPGARVHQARREPRLEGVIETGLVAGDAGVDLVAPAGRRLVDELGVGEQRPRHADHVGAAFGQDRLGDLGHVDVLAGVRDQELVDEIAFAAHQLDAVVAGLACEPGATHERADLALDAGRAQRARRKRRDRTAQARRRDAQRRVAVAPGVQDLQRDLAALGMHRVGHGSVAARAGAGTG